MWHCNKCEWYYLSECPKCSECPPKSSVSAREQFGVLQNDPLSEYWLSSSALDPVHCNCLVVRQQAPQWTVHRNIRCPTVFWRAAQLHRLLPIGVRCSLKYTLTLYCTFVPLIQREMSEAILYCWSNLDPKCWSELGLRCTAFSHWSFLWWTFDTPAKG